MSSFSQNPPRWHEVTAVFGGRFDPPHLGHREAVRGLFKNPGVKAVRLLPSGNPPHKPTSANMENRAEMTRINFLPIPGEGFPSEIEVDYRELNRAKSEPERPSYSFDTLKELQKEFPEMAFVLGADQLSLLPTWHRFPEVLGLCHWIVLERLPEGNDLAHTTLQQWQSSGLIQSIPGQSKNLSSWKISMNSRYLIVSPTEAANISSTSIREDIARTGFPGQNKLLSPVLAHLKDHKLYGI